jgi:hypothetical protein
MLRELDRAAVLPLRRVSLAFTKAGWGCHGQLVRYTALLDKPAVAPHNQTGKLYFDKLEGCQRCGDLSVS